MRYGTILALTCMLSFLMNGCTASQPTRFYVLNAHEASAEAGAPDCRGGRPLTIGVGPVDLPKYLDRPQIMTRVDENELHLSEFDEWAEPLDSSIADVMARNLRSLMCAHVETFPWRVSEEIGYRISTKVIRLDGTPGGQAVLDVWWSVSDEQAKKTLFTKESRYAEPVPSGTNEALVSAYSRLLAAFSREIAETFKSMRLVQDR